MKAVLIAVMLLISGVASASQFAGTWTGQYHVTPRFDHEHIYSVTLKIVDTTPSKHKATFYFHETPISENVENLYQTAGCLAMTGSVNPKTNKITLNSTGWLGGKKLDRAELLTASVSGNTLAGNGVQSTYDKSPPSLNLTKSDESKALLPTRCEVGGAVSTIVPPSEATIGFMNAMSSANYDVMAIYLQKGADINCKNCSDSSKDLESQTSPLIKSTHGAGYGVIRMVKWLVDHGADVNQADAYGRTPVMYAAQWNQLASGMGATIAQGDDHLLQYLLSAGGKIGNRDLSLSNAIGMLTPSGSSVGIEFQRIGFEQTVTQLIAKGEDINLPNQFGDTTLIRAARNCADSNIPTILNLGGDPSIKNAMGQTALDIALIKAQTNIPQCNSVLKILSNPNLAKPAKVSVSNTAEDAAVLSVFDALAGPSMPIGGCESAIIANNKVRNQAVEKKDFRSLLVTLPISVETIATCNSRFKGNSTQMGENLSKRSLQDWSMLEGSLLDWWLILDSNFGSDMHDAIHQKRIEHAKILLTYAISKLDAGSAGAKNAADGLKRLDALNN